MDRMSSQWPMKKMVDISIIIGHHIKLNHIYITKNRHRLQPVSPINDPKMNIKCQVKLRKYKYRKKNREKKRNKNKNL